MSRHAQTKEYPEEDSIRELGQHPPLGLEPLLIRIAFVRFRRAVLNSAAAVCASIALFVLGATEATCRLRLVILVYLRNGRSEVYVNGRRVTIDSFAGLQLFRRSASVAGAAVVNFAPTSRRGGEALRSRSLGEELIRVELGGDPNAPFRCSVRRILLRVYVRNYHGHHESHCHHNHGRCEEHACKCHTSLEHACKCHTSLEHACKCHTS